MLSFHDIRSLPLRRLPSTVSCSMIVGSVSWRQTWLNHDSLRRFIVKATDVRRRYRPVSIHIRLYARHANLYPTALVFKGSDSPLQIRSQRPPLISIGHYWQDKWLVEFNLCQKNWWRCFFHSIAGPVMAEGACACLIFTSSIDVPSSVCVHPQYLNWSTSSSVIPLIHMLVDGFVTRSSCLHSFCKLLLVGVLQTSLNFFTACLMQNTKFFHRHPRRPCLQPHWIRRHQLLPVGIYLSV